MNRNGKKRTERKRKINAKALLCPTPKLELKKRRSPFWSARHPLPLHPHPVPPSPSVELFPQLDRILFGLNTSPTIKSSADLRQADTDSQYYSDINQMLFQLTGSGDESRTSHHTTEMNVKHKDATLFSTLTATMSCAAE